MSAASVAPMYDCPPCPKCGSHVGTPALVDCGVEPGRWHGPDDANLWCPSCGTGWVGTIADVVLAARAWIAYEQSQAERPDARRILERFKYTAPGLTNAELSLLERFVTELEGP